MGGTPLLALSIAAFPEELETDVVAAVFSGADEKVRAAGAILAGGHTIRDAEPKYGLAVVGTSIRRRLDQERRPARRRRLRHQAARHGARARGQGRRREAARWMTTLNDRAAEALRPFSPHAVTDVTGFGLLGHAHETAERSGVRIRLVASALPALEGALEAAAPAFRTGGDPRQPRLRRPARVERRRSGRAARARLRRQTAAGLLVTLPAEKALSSRRSSSGPPLPRPVGSVEEGAGVVLEP
jgi:selenide,water dikinase